MTYDRSIHRLLVLSLVSSCLSMTGCAGISWLKGDSNAPVAAAPSIQPSTQPSTQLSTQLSTEATIAGDASDGPSAAPVLKSKRVATRTKASKKSNAQFAQQFSKARGFEAEKNHKQARSIYEQLIVAHPDRYEAYHRLAVVADRQRRHREAEALYSEALRLQPMNGPLLGDLGYCYFLQGKLTKAESALAKAIAVEPAVSRHHNNLGLVYGHQSRHEESLEKFRRAGSEADAQYNLAFVLASQDKGEDAKRCFHAALMADPAHEKSHTALAAFERYERTPEELRDEFTGSADGRWVLYSEAVGEKSQVQPAVATGKGRVLQAQARQMMSSRAATR